MNHFELFKLKSCHGLDNRGLNNIIINHQKYRKQHYTALEYARMAGLKKTRFEFIDSYQSLDLKIVNQNFKQHQMLTIFDSAYPDWLKEISNPPIVLFYQGNIKLLATQMIAIVGARTASITGKRSVEKLVEPMVKLTIVSGLARGIDTAAHLSAIKFNHSTIGVIGSGLDIFYPAENKKLQKYLAEKHLLLSEYINGTPPLRHHFPARNRIIAGLVRGVIVIEAKARSGSLITCQCALEFGREVFAVPGDIISGQSSGCHQLIQLGAKCTENIQDVLDEFY
ncbi:MULTISPECIES: DNA-processing protein DprA [unclassified Enterococcus]|uniref:DNA-processing protein DprA n=1 Tax=unclassified Enterococcus TaxID=2608891 RepID=UPI0015573661|nr:MULTISPECIES: DNA-processing protein DprA [unclassified Enterococcus]MBS7576513.1 DNA-processing protein DprA [Enterococcus sp. MMGLQ5-2]MBS7585594.1 DNA-processing protein DprA [Enterococcus sp. MMGLQ5-1]NPD13453.1 DNA-protecting protein DprA [Enterococcus sp. MMGLQ5-1]NPD36350.1 DNA-protecting protein DprA [Enterococcus sp. MMGLQ5-2]